MTVGAEIEAQSETVTWLLRGYQQSAEQFRQDRERLAEELAKMVGGCADIEGFPSEVHYAHGRNDNGELKFCWQPLQEVAVTLIGHQILAFERAKGLLVAALDMHNFNPTLADSHVPYAYRFPLDGIVDLSENPAITQTR
jgi:hypothetical protein